MDSRDCPHHASDRVICHHEGTVVCRECALVLDAQWFDFSPIHRPEQKQNSYLIEILADIVENNFLPPEIIPKTIELYTKRNKNNIYQPALLAHCAYLALKSLKVSRSIEEISQMFNVLSSDVWKLGKQTNDIQPMKTREVLSRLDTSSLTRQRKKFIEDKGDYFSRFIAVSPRTMTAALWYLSGSESMKKVGLLCRVSPTSIARVLKKFSSHDFGIEPDTFDPVTII